MGVAKKYTKAREKRDEVVSGAVEKIMENLRKVPDAKWSKRMDRVYIPFESQTSDLKDVLTKEEKHNETNIRYLIHRLTNDLGHELDYKKGTVRVNGDKREYKLIKFINKIVELYTKKAGEAYDEQIVEQAKKLSQEYNQLSAKIGKHKDKYLIVYSSHPYDIAGMSTDRGWESCMNVYTGSNRSYVIHDIEKGSIIAYLIRETDLNVKKPVARMLIPVYIREDFDERNKDDYFVYIANQGKSYGTAPQDFYSTVNEMLERVQGKRVGTFQSFSCRYRDGEDQDREIFRGGSEEERKELEYKKVLKRLGAVDKGDIMVSEGNIDLRGLNLSSLKFFDKPWEVYGYFDCSKNNLTSLEGAPRRVGSKFDCSDNQLTSLEGAPQKVGENFSCSNNQLESLEGAPQEVGGSFLCSSNQLTTLKGSPQVVYGTFDCDSNKLTSLDGALQKVDGNFYCSKNLLTSLEGAPKEVGRSFFCYDNQLKTLRGSPQKVGSSFNCASNQLTTLEGAPQEVGGSFVCPDNHLTSLKGAPSKVGENYNCSRNQLTSLEGAPQRVNGHFYCHDNQLTSLEGSPQKVSGEFACTRNQLTSLEGAPQIVEGTFYCSDNPNLSQEEIDAYLQKISRG